MNEEEADRLVAALYKYVDDVAQMERQILIRDLEGLIQDYRLRQPNYQDAKGKMEQSEKELIRVLVEVTQ
jgi:hypothetical protein